MATDQKSMPFYADSTWAERRCPCWKAWTFCELHTAAASSEAIWTPCWCLITTLCAVRFSTIKTSCPSGTRVQQTRFYSTHDVSVPIGKEWVGTPESWPWDHNYFNVNRFFRSERCSSSTCRGYPGCSWLGASLGHLVCLTFRQTKTLSLRRDELLKAMESLQSSLWDHVKRHQVWITCKKFNLQLRRPDAQNQILRGIRPKKCFPVLILQRLGPPTALQVLGLRPTRLFRKSWKAGLIDPCCLGRLSQPSTKANHVMQEIQVSLVSVSYHNFLVDLSFCGCLIGVGSKVVDDGVFAFERFRPSQHHLHGNSSGFNAHQLSTSHCQRMSSGWE